VREYWIVDPDSQTVSVHVPEDGKYITSAYGESDIISSHALENCKIALGAVYFCFGRGKQA
jgi:Uma2 family endonuclease